MTLAVKVTPNARKSEVTGWGADEQGRRVLLVKLAAPAQDGKANKELIRFMAEFLGCAKSAVSLTEGRLEPHEGPGSSSGSSGSIGVDFGASSELKAGRCATLPAFMNAACQPLIFDTAFVRASIASFQASCRPSLATEKDFFTTLPGSGLHEASTCS